MRNERVLKDKPDFEFMSEFFLAIEEGNLERVQELFFSNYNIHPDQSNNNDTNAVRILSKMNNMSDSHFKIAELLFNHGANPNLEFSDETIPLHLAAENNKKFVQMLLEKGANATHLDEKRRAPFYYAALAGNNELAELLCTEIKKQNSKNFNVLMELSLITAAKSRHISVIKFILSNNLININQPIDYKIIIETLKELCGEENVESDKDEALMMDGSTALHLVFLKIKKPPEMLSLINLLKNHGANVNAKNALGKTAYQLAEEFDASQEIKDALKPADLNKQLEKTLIEDAKILSTSQQKEWNQIWQSCQSKSGNKTLDASGKSAVRRAGILARHITATISSNFKEKKSALETAQQPLHNDVPDDLKKQSDQSVKQKTKVVGRVEFAWQSLKQMGEIEMRKANLEKQLNQRRG